MRIKGFKIGKSKEKDAETTQETAAEQIVEMEDKINGRTKDLKETTKELEELSIEATDDEEASVGPHGPIDELTVEAEDEKADDEDILAGPHAPLNELSIEPEDKFAELDDNAPEEELSDGNGELKVVKVKVGSETPEAENEPKVEGLNDDPINNLFADEEEEENPLANLIRVMPDVTARELVDDIEEIQGIIKEWQKS